MKNYVQNHAVNSYCKLFVFNLRPNMENYSLLLSNKYSKMLVKIQTYFL